MIKFSLNQLPFGVRQPTAATCGTGVPHSTPPASRVRNCFPLDRTVTPLKEAKASRISYLQIGGAGIFGFEIRRFFETGRRRRRPSSWLACSMSTCSSPSCTNAETDAYFAAFAKAGGWTLVTFDRGMNRFPGISSKILSPRGA